MTYIYNTYDAHIQVLTFHLICRNLYSGCFLPPLFYYKHGVSHLDFKQHEYIRGASVANLALKSSNLPDSFTHTHSPALKKHKHKQNPSDTVFFPIFQQVPKINERKRNPTSIWERSAISVDLQN